MAINEELDMAIDEVLEGVNETIKFKTMFKKLIENYLKDNYNEGEILEVVNLIKLNSEEGDLNWR